MSKARRRLIISDTPTSAISTSSRIWAKKFNADLLYALDYSSVNRLLEALEVNPEWILFSWRGCLETILKDRFLARRLNSISKLSVIYFSVPDHIDISHGIIKTDKPIYQYADGFTVVSRRLQDLYKKCSGIELNPSYLPDFPDLDLVDEVSRIECEKSRNSVIWVGNSKWGENSGFSDHKGYKSILSKVISSSQLQNLPWKFIVVDRGKSYLPHRDTLIKIAQSEFLLQTSSSEGTGLPILEALALGAYPITTDVGVNREVLDEEWVNFHAETPSDFIKSMSLRGGTLDPMKLRTIYSQYIARCSEVIDQFIFPAKSRPVHLDEFREGFVAKLGFDFKGRIRWRLRYLRNRVITIRQGNRSL